jgi:hypothetical protein
MKQLEGEERNQKSVIQRPKTYFKRNVLETVNKMKMGKRPLDLAIV